MKLLPDRIMRQIYPDFSEFTEECNAEQPSNNFRRNTCERLHPDNYHIWSRILSAPLGGESILSHTISESYPPRWVTIKVRTGGTKGPGIIIIIMHSSINLAKTSGWKIQYVQ